jgi:hypothetical protein
MKHATFTLLALCVTALAAPAERVRDFELADQHEQARRYRFPKTKVTVMTVADHRGSDQLGPWIERLYAHYEKRIDIDGVADVSVIAAPFRSMLRAAFKKQLAYSVMLDWQGEVVRQFAYDKGVANLYVIDRQGRIVKRHRGPVTDDAMRELVRAIDRAVAGKESP